MNLSRIAGIVSGVFAMIGTACLLMVAQYAGWMHPFDFYDQTFELPSHYSVWTFASGMIVSYAIAAASGWFAVRQRGGS